MLKGALYVNIAVLLVIAVVVLIFSARKSIKKNYLPVAIAGCFITLANAVLISNYIDSDYDVLITNPILVVAGILFIVGTILSARKIAGRKTESKSENTSENNSEGISGKSSLIPTVAMIAVPLLVILVPLCCELYLLGNCSYLIRYRYNNGIITAEDSTLVIVNNKPYKVDLTINPWNRESKYTLRLNSETAPYYISYNDDGSMEISTGNETEGRADMIMSIGEVLKDNHGTIKEAEIYYLPEQDSAIISYYDGRDWWSNSFYCAGVESKRPVVFGSVESISYYE